MILGELLQKIGFSVDTSGLEHVHEKLEGINRSVKFLAATEIGEMLYSLAERFADFGEHLEATSLAAGLTTDELQRLQYAASQNAVKGDELTGALARLNRQLYSAKQGGKQATAIFSKLGIGPEQIATFRNSADALAAIQDSMMGVEDANERQALTMQLFGRGSSNMIKFLTIGSKATEKLGNDADTMGAVVRHNAIKALAEFEDKASGLGMVIKGFLATLGSQLAPAFVELIDMIEHAWGENLPAIQANIRAFAIKFAFYMGAMAEIVRLAIKLAIYLAKEYGSWLLVIVKYGPAVMAAAAAFDLFVEALTKVRNGWQAVAKYAPIGWKALLWGFEKLQLLAAYGLEAMVQFFGMFSPALAMNIRAVGLAMTRLTPPQFMLVVAAIAALGVAMHDLYQYFFNDVPFEKLWIGRLLKRAEPVISRLKWLLRPFKDLFMLGDLDADDPARAVTYEQNLASRMPAPMQAAAGLQSMFDGAGRMGVKFDAQDPTGVSHTKTNIVVNSPVNITMSKSMNTQDVVRMANEGVANAWQRVVNDAWHDAHPAAAR